MRWVRKSGGEWSCCLARGLSVDFGYPGRLCGITYLSDWVALVSAELTSWFDEVSAKSSWPVVLTVSAVLSVGILVSKMSGLDAGRAMNGSSRFLCFLSCFRLTMWTRISLFGWPITKQTSSPVPFSSHYNISDEKSCARLQMQDTGRAMNESSRFLWNILRFPMTCSHLTI